MKRSMEKPGIRENIGKSLLDVAKLTFASFILGGILRGQVPQYILILAGVVALPHLEPPLYMDAQRRAINVLVPLFIMLVLYIYA